MTATATNTINATMSSPSPIVNVWSGGTTNQLVSSDAPTAATTPATSPPMAEMAITSARNSSSTVGSVM